VSGFLEQMALSSRARAAAARRTCSFAQLSAAAQAAPRRRRCGSTLPALT
jgi:hypothetical protein